MRESSSPALPSPIDREEGKEGQVTSINFW